MTIRVTRFDDNNNKHGTLAPQFARHQIRPEPLEALLKRMLTLFILKEEEKALSAKHGVYMMNNYYDKGAMVPYGYNTYGGYGNYPYGYGGQYSNGYYGYMTYGR
uniref:RNA-binding (RRM/RBD/RNP motifs) family protein n=1 Tax=Angiostrongylus cantonensis TaxID=6313 RepID=A0A0K0D3A0_ANGCA